MITRKNDFYIGSNQLKGLIDLECPENFNGKIILFVHGYMGFKDWGAWNLIQDFFVSKGYAFCKFNLTHNGIGLSEMETFIELDLFSKNTYSKEVYDVSCAIEYVLEKIPNYKELILMGHSRGGGDVLLVSEDKRISKIITLAAISSVEKRFSDKNMLQKWENEKIRFVMNQRTKQNMPHDYLQVEDFYQNKEKLDISTKVKNLNVPLLLIHGDQDTSVPIEEAYELEAWSKQKLIIIKDTDHVFGSAHPWKSNHLPEKLKEVCELVLRFLG